MSDQFRGIVDGLIAEMRAEIDARLLDLLRAPMIPDLGVDQCLLDQHPGQNVDGYEIRAASSP